MSIREISDEIARLAALSKSRKIKVDDLKGSTFTISSLGSFGGKFFTPIINPPEVAILGISKSYDSVLLKGTKPVSTTNLPISLSYDHRIINGVEALNLQQDFVKFSQILVSLRRIFNFCFHSSIIFNFNHERLPFLASAKRTQASFHL